jgi:hypothetical protein
VVGGATAFSMFSNCDAVRFSAFLIKFEISEVEIVVVEGPDSADGSKFFTSEIVP